MHAIGTVTSNPLLNFNGAVASVCRRSGVPKDQKVRFAPGVLPHASAS